jgi:hypothetical protein
MGVWGFASNLSASVEVKGREEKSRHQFLYCDWNASLAGLFVAIKKALFVEGHAPK